MKCWPAAAATSRQLALLLCCTFAAMPANAAQAPAPAAAQRIVSLAPNLTELTYAAGAGDRLVGADAYSNYPPAAAALPRVGDAFQVDYERLLSLRPDAVLVWTTGTPEPVIEKLGSLGLRVERVTTARLEDVARGLRSIGELAGTSTVAEPAARAYLAEVAALKAQHQANGSIAVFYQISEAPLYTVNGQHMISEIITLCGGRNVFAEVAQLAPPVSLEAVLERDPEVIITADGAVGEPLALWRKWPQLRAVRYGNLFTVSADRVARATPRIIEGAQQVCAILEEARRKRDAAR